MVYELVQSWFFNNALEGHSPLHWWSPVWGAFAKRKNKGILTEPLVCARHCMECFTCIMESKLPPTVTYPLFYAPPEKQNHYQSIKGWHPGCIHWGNYKSQGPALPQILPRFPEGPQQCVHMPIFFVKFAKDIPVVIRPLSLCTLTSSLSHYALC